MPTKNQANPSSVRGRLALSATATAIVPGPVVMGMVSGNIAMSSAPAADAACSCLRASCCSGRFSRSQAVSATTTPPATRSAASVMPKNASTNDPAHSATIITSSE